jgi:hypothetical protein
LVAIARAHGRELRMTVPVVVDSVSHVGQRYSGTGTSHPLGQRRGHRRNPLRCFAGHHQRRHRRIGLAGSGYGRRSLLDHHVGIRATEPERGHPGPPRPLHGWPLLFFGNHFQAHLIKRNVWIGVSEVQILRDAAQIHRQHRFDETRDTGGRLEMAEIRLDRAQQQRRLFWTPTAQDRAEGTCLDGIAEQGSGPWVST